MLKKIATCLFLCTGLVLQAQSAEPYKIKGKIKNEDKTVIRDVYLEMIGNPHIKITTNEKGEYELNVPTEKTKLKIYKDGFEEKTIEVDFSGNENRITYVDVILTEKATNIEEVIIFDNPSLVTNSRSAIQQKLDKIAGGVYLANLFEQKTQRTQTLKDAIGKVPGVIIQEFFWGNDQPRLNVRGSGIQSNPQSRGISLLQDGIPINFADGSYIIGVLEPQAAHLVEVYKGSNGVEYGSSTLGGAVNFVTKNGYNAAPLYVKMERGSFDYFNGSISSGFNFGKNDVFITTSYNNSDGFRENNTSSRFNALLNMGRRFTEKFESRLFANYTDLRFEIPGPLTKEQMLGNPRQINTFTPMSIGPNVKRDHPNRLSKILRIGNKNTYKISDKATMSSTVYYQYVDDTFTFPIATGVRQNLNNDFGGDISFEHKSKRNNFRAGIKIHYGDTDQSYFINKLGEKSDLFSRHRLVAFNQNIFVNNVFSLTEKIQLVTAIQASWDSREIEDKTIDPTQRPVFNAQNGQTRLVASPAINKKYNFWGINPKIGIIVNPTQNIQTFANFSRSYEPPTFLELININGGTVNSSPTRVEVADLNAQTASTVELGSRMKIGDRFTANASLYHTWIKGEILTLTDLVGIAGNTINSPSKTTHSGAEVSLNAKIFKNIFGQNDFVNLGAIYNLSYFQFTEGEIYKNNQIAGIPRHHAQFSVDYKHPSGFFINLNTESIFGKTQVLHQNSSTIYQDPYTLLNARLGMQKHRWGVFVEGRNLGDKRYAGSYLIRDTITVPAPMMALGATQNNVTTYIPGVGFNFILGVNYTL